MGKEVKEIKRKQKRRRVIKRKERRGQMKRTCVREKHETGSEGGGGRKVGIYVLLGFVTLG